MSDFNITPKGVIPTEKTTQQIKIEGDIRIRTIVLIIIGALLGIITVMGTIGVVFYEASFGKYWSGFQAIISGSIFGLIGFITGKSSTERE